MEDTKEVALLPDEIACIREIEAQIKELQTQAQGALRMLAKIHGLTGNWDFRNDKFVRMEK